jgi:hypothetical protein
MRTLVGFGLSLLLGAGLFAQHRGGFSNPRPFAPGTFGNVVFPGGWPPLTVPGAITDPTFASRLGATVAWQGHWRPPSVPGTRRPATVFVYGYPLFVGGCPANDCPAEPAPQEQPSTAVIDPPQPAPAIVERFGSDDAQDPTTPTAAADDLQPVEEPPSTAEPPHYLIVFKDHSIYSAVAYWVDGDTLHYFTSGNTHNQVSVSLVDRDLTKRLNEESGLEVKLPPAK